MNNPERAADIRIDFILISQMIKEGSTVLDVGCGDGDLLEFLSSQKKIDARGIEITASGVKNSISKGLSVIQGNAEKDIKFYPDNSFDYVLLSQTLQAVNRPDLLLKELLRVGKKAIVSFPNFGYWRVRFNLMLKGTMPMNKTLSHPWYSSPNIHFCTIRDFVGLCDELDMKIINHMAINAGGIKMKFDHLGIANFFATQGLYLITK